MNPVEDYQELFSTFLNRHKQKEVPKNLYAPIDYILNLKGKRIRPALVLMATDCFGHAVRDALPAAMAIEVFHNFTLMHDDIMDAAPLRRGQATVHKKWSANTAILSGDAMLIQAFRWLNSYPAPLFTLLTKQLTKTALQVCEGQRYDIDFERQSDVQLPDYLKMIKYKTAVLMGCALKMGALVAKASEREAKQMDDFGIKLGVAFQLQDDYLDVFGNEKTFGKQAGGDIVENKKTILYHKTVALGGSEHKKALINWFQVSPENPKEKIQAVQSLFVDSGAKKEVQQLILKYTKEALNLLEGLKTDRSKKKILKMLATQLMNRSL